MSIQDESFPYDEDLEFSCSSSKNFVFPHRNKCPNLIENKAATESEISDKNHVFSSSPPLENQIESTQSSSDLYLSSETSSKTPGSEPKNIHDSPKKNTDFVGHNQKKSISYQDIHSEYTKRRYRHVESKVGQYIANMKALDEKRRNASKFQRHVSMPETLHETEITSNNDSDKHGILRRSTDDLHHLHQQYNDLRSDHDADNYENFTTTTSSLSTKDLLHSENVVFLDKLAYEQLLNDKERKDYLQTKLDEKNAENWRLKQNLDTMRIEYSMCKDKLKQLSQAQRFTGSLGAINSSVLLGRTSSQIFYCPQETKEKSTQTDKMAAHSPVPLEDKSSNDMFDTPFTPDSNNNSFDNAAVGVLAPAIHKVSKCVATIQPLSLQFSNLVDQDLNNTSISTIDLLHQRANCLQGRKKSTHQLPVNISKISSVVSSLPSNSDSAIDIEAAESPKIQSRNRCENIVFYEQHSQRYPVVETCNADQNKTATNNNTTAYNNNTEDCITNSNRKNCRRRRSGLRSRLVRFFAACTKCDDTNTSPRIANNSQHSQIPLL